IPRDREAFRRLRVTTLVEEPHRDAGRLAQLRRLRHLQVRNKQTRVQVVSVARPRREAPRVRPPALTLAPGTRLLQRPGRPQPRITLEYSPAKLDSHCSLERRAQQVAMHSDQIVEITLTPETGGAGAGHLAQLLQVAHVGNGGHDLFAGEPLAVAEDVLIALVLHVSSRQ